MWEAVRDGIWVGAMRCWGKLQLCSHTAVSLALSSVRETPTVGAVSLTANEFPAKRRGAEGVCGCAAASVCLMDVWVCGMATAAGTKGKEETRERMQPSGCSGNP